MSHEAEISLFFLRYLIFSRVYAAIIHSVGRLVRHRLLFWCFWVIFIQLLPKRLCKPFFPAPAQPQATSVAGYTTLFPNNFKITPFFGRGYATCSTIHPRKLIQLPKSKHLRKRFLKHMQKSCKFSTIFIITLGGDLFWYF